MVLPLPTSLSPSKVSSFKDCALAFRFSNIDRLPEPPSPAATKGSLVHRALELLFCEPGPERTLPAALDCLDRARAEFATDPEFVGLELDAEAAAGFAADAEVLIRRYFTLEDPRTVRPIGLELMLEAQVGSLKLRGIIDRLDLDADGGLVVTDYKGLATETPLPTPTGWTTMGEVRKGDFLLGADGSPTRVVEKSTTHFRPCYRIVFDDASSIVCDNEHLWPVRIGSDRRARDKLLNADELFNLWEAGTRPVVVRNSAPLDLPATALPIDPYVLGVWLGDGHSRKGTIHVGAADVDHVTSELAARGESVTDATSPSERAKGMRLLSLGRPDSSLCIRGHANRRQDRPDGRPGDCRTCERGNKDAFPTNGTLFRRLSALGVIGREVRPQERWARSRANKHVPPEYLRGSQAQRLGLLRGLMDTDGHWNPIRRQAVFSTTTEELAEAVADLVCGLGGRAYTYSEPYESARGLVMKYQVMFTPSGYNPFTLPRKADGCRIEGTPRGRRRAVRSIERIPTVPTQCVVVDAADSLYLAGRQMVPTHNSGKVPGVIHEQSRLGGVHFYAFLCEKVLGRRPARIQLLYLSQPVAIVCEPSAQSIRGLEQRTAAIWKAVERACANEDFRPRPSALCNWCSFQEYCPSFGGDPARVRELVGA